MNLSVLQGKDRYAGYARFRQQALEIRYLSQTKRNGDSWRKSVVSRHARLRCRGWLHNWGAC